MTHEKMRQYLIERLLSEQAQDRRFKMPEEERAQRDLLRALMNVRPAAPIDDAFAAVQDAYLQEAIRRKGVTAVSELTPAENGIYLWKGDITTLACDAIVNAANAGMTGCYYPCHGCIDNCIHTYAGIQLRIRCASLMDAQGHEEPTGRAKITPAYNLPSKYVIHTVGPIVSNGVTARQEKELESCYRSCLTLAAQNGVKSLAFCCISTGVFGFPKRRAAEIAVRTVRGFLSENSGMEVIFDVFETEDYEIYRGLLGVR